MTKEQARDRIAEVKIIPVVRVATPELALRASQAIAEGGIPIVEITMTVPGAVGVIRELRRSTQMLVGAGTVLDPDMARECIDAGAQFLVSPGFDLPTVAFAREAGILMLPGALTPTEVMTAWKSGADLVKIFPCGCVGGSTYIRALKAALPQVALVPTGGVTPANAAQFIDAGALAVGIGGELVSKTALERRDFSNITHLARECASAVHAFMPDRQEAHR